MQLNLAELSPAKRYGILSSLIVPRPIAWVTTLDEDGQVNAAPFSYFQIMGENPPLVVLGIGRRRRWQREGQLSQYPPRARIRHQHRHGGERGVHESVRD